MEKAGQFSSERTASFISLIKKDPGLSIRALALWYQLTFLTGSSSNPCESKVIQAMKKRRKTPSHLFFLELLQ